MDLISGSSTPDTRKKIAVSTLALADDTDNTDTVDGTQPRRKLLKAPALAELESSDSGSEVSVRVVVWT